MSCKILASELSFLEGMCCHEGERESEREREREREGEREKESKGHCDSLIPFWGAVLGTLIEGLRPHRYPGTRSSGSPLDPT